MNGIGANGAGQEGAEQAATESGLEAIDKALDESTLQHEPSTDEDRAQVAAAEAARAGDDPPKGDAATADAKPEATADAKPEEQKDKAPEQAAGAKTPLDELLAPKEAGKAERLTEADLAMPEELKGADKAKQAERWGKLQRGWRAEAERADAAEAQVAQYTPQIQRLQQIDATMQEVRAQPAQVSAFVEFLGALNQGNFTHARQMLVGALGEIDAATGQPSGAVDHVAGHADLKAAVEKGELTEEYAEQIALARAREQQHEDRLAGVAQERQQRGAEDAHAQVYIQARDDLNLLDEHLMHRDPLYQRLRPQLLHAAGQLERSNVDPSAWVAIMTQHYKTARAMLAAGGMATSPNGGATPGREEQLARPGALPASGVGAPTVANAASSLEAMDIALRNAGLA